MKSLLHSVYYFFLIEYSFYFQDFWLRRQRKRRESVKLKRVIKMEMSHCNSKNNLTPSSENEERDDFDTVKKPQELIKTFGSYTTLHGFHFLTDSSSVLRRILWLLLMVVCLVILIVQIQTNYAKLQRHDSSVTKDIEFSRSLLFPAVSICNQNMLRRSKILDTDAQLYLDRIDYIKAEYMNSTEFMREQSRQINASFDLEKVVKEAGHNLTSMLALCLWKGETCGPENFTSFVSFYVSGPFFFIAARFLNPKLV